MVFTKYFIGINAFFFVANAKDCSFQLEDPDAPFNLQAQVNGLISLNDDNLILQADGTPLRDDRECRVTQGQWKNANGDYLTTFESNNGNQVPLTQVFAMMKNKVMRRNIQPQWSALPALLDGRTVALDIECQDNISGCFKFQVEAESLPWGYHTDGYIPPSEWKNVFPECNGMQQSPIDLPPPSVSSLPPSVKAPFFLSGTCDHVELIELEGNLEWSVEESHTGHPNDCVASVFDAQDREFDLIQFHLHHPSEHTIQGSLSDLEIHFVHVQEEGDVMVIGILMDVVDGARNNTLIEDLLSSTTNHAVFPIQPVYDDFLINTSGYYNYPGSFTTPPCTEIVDWWVRRESVAISAAQLQDMKTWFRTRPASNDGANNRPIQRRHGRQVEFV